MLRTVCHQALAEAFFKQRINGLQSWKRLATAIRFYVPSIVPVLFRGQSGMATEVSAEVGGFVKMQPSEPVPSVVTVLAYAVAFYLLSLSLRTIPIGVAYAVWSGVGIVLITVIGAVAFKQVPDLPAVIGMVLIIAGVLLINLMSRMSVRRYIEGD